MENQRLQKSLDDGPLISVITVVLNGARYLEQTMQSVLNQTYGNLEYIIIDGGSTDGSVDIINRYSSYLAYWHTRPDKGVSQAYNLGLAQAKGTWILFLGADDYFLDSQVVEKMGPYLTAHQDADVIFGETIIMTQEAEPRPSPLVKVCGRPWRWQEFRRFNTIPHPSAFTNRRYLDRVGTFEESYRVAMDYDLYLRGGKNLRAQYVSIAVSGMREGGLSRASIRHTWSEGRRAQQATKALPPSLAWLNFFWLIVRIYAGKVAHKMLDPIASQITWIRRTPGKSLRNL